MPLANPHAANSRTEKKTKKISVVQIANKMVSSSLARYNFVELLRHTNWACNGHLLFMVTESVKEKILKVASRHKLITTIDGSKIVPPVDSMLELLIASPKLHVIGDPIFEAGPDRYMIDLSGKNIAVPAAEFDTIRHHHPLAEFYVVLERGHHKLVFVDGNGKVVASLMSFRRRKWARGV